MGDCIAKSIYDETGKQVGVEIVQADDEVDISLELVEDIERGDRRFAHKDGDVVTLGTINTVQYRIIGPSLTVPYCVRAVKIEGRHIDSEKRDAMKAIDHKMLLIKSLDQWAALRFSEYTSKWYVDAKIEISNGEVLGGITEHADTPALAVARYLNALKAVPPHMVIVTRANSDNRRHWRWNGAAFLEEPVAWLKNQVASGGAS